MRRMRGVVTLLSLPVLLPLGALFLWVSDMPRNVAGMAAHTVCSGTFVAGRPWADVRRDDLLAAAVSFTVVGVEVDELRRRVVARFPGGVERGAREVDGRGCVLEPLGTESNAGSARAQPDREIAAGAERSPAGPGSADPDVPWPDGTATLPAGRWPPEVDALRLQAVAQAHMAGAGDPKDSNARALSVVYRNRLLVDRHGPGFDAATPLHGWSMSKTVVGMLADRLAAEQHIALSRPVVDWLGNGPRAPSWAEAWRADARSRITVEDLLYMRDGLDHEEDYKPWSAVPTMLYGQDDIAGYAAQERSEDRPGRRWRYSSFASNLLARVVRARFDSDEAYWRYPAQAVFGPIGARTALLETDTDGTWIASSYLWASSGDWARIGQLLLADGRWGDRQVLPPGVLARISTPSRPEGPGRGYGAQAWRVGDRQAGACRLWPGVPEDTIAMTGHWGQLVAIVPSREAVIVRLGWTVAPDRFAPCRLIADIVAALPPRAEPPADLASFEDRPALPPAEPPGQARSKTAAMP